MLHTNAKCHANKILAFYSSELENRLPEQTISLMNCTSKHITYHINRIMAQGIKKTWKLAKEDQLNCLIVMLQMDVMICGGILKFLFQICKFLAEL